MRLAISGLVVPVLVLLIQANPVQAQDAASVRGVESPTIPLLDWTFSPGNVTIVAGGTVTWTTEGALDHTVSSETGAFDGNLSRGRPYSRTFDTPGVFAYFCEPHPWMTGAVTVLPAQAPSESPEAEEPPEMVEEEM